MNYKSIKQLFYIKLSFKYNMQEEIISFKN